MEEELRADDKVYTPRLNSNNCHIDTDLSCHQFTAAGVVNTKQQRMEDEVLNLSSYAESYTTNSNKELLCLEYVLSFQRQFEQMFPSRRKLFVIAPNETGVRKFVCTTIRPSLIPYRDLYDCNVLARFLAGSIQYEPLVNPLQPPTCLPSPTFTLSWKAGDCFDISIVLVSFLIGAGYDAYVVSGFAPRWICLLDQSTAPAPNLHISSEKNLASSITSRHDNYQIKSSKVDQNDFITRNTLASKFEEYQSKTTNSNVHHSNDHFPNKQNTALLEEEDKFMGERVHAWVLVRAGKRDVNQHFFIESTTGETYNIHTSPYLRIESVWNHENYWVNMQKQHINTTLFDLKNPTDWEYIFLSATDKPIIDDQMKPSAEGENDVDDMAGDKAMENPREMEEEIILDVPPSWVNALAIDRTTYKSRFVNNSQRMGLFLCAKVEEFAENAHDQGLVARISWYENVECTLPTKINEYFRNRKDKLESRVRYPMDGRLYEYFGPGRLPEALKSRMECIGEKREFEFYTSARMDGLAKRDETIRVRTEEHYYDREDHLVTRSVTLAHSKDTVDPKNPYVLPGGPTGEIAVRKMKEKFSRNLKFAADADVRTKTYNIYNGTIRLDYHYAPGKITAGYRVFHKNSTTQPEVYLADTSAIPLRKSALEDQLTGSIQMEKDCYAAIRHSEMETQDILKIRKREEANVVLETSIFDMNENDLIARQADESTTNNETKTVIDYLSPFLQTVQATDKELTKEEAQTVREMCLRNLKDRLLERANIIQGRLERENALLAKRQAAFQRSQREHEQAVDGEFERFCSETMFRIQILEQRLASHEETALQKYTEMDQRLHLDPRLGVLYR